MRLHPPRIWLAGTAAALITAACSLSQIPISFFGRGTEAAVTTLQTCGQTPEVLCLVTFGIEPPERMLVVLLASPDLPAAMDVVITQAEDTFNYECGQADQSTGMITCSGPQLALGSRIRVQVYSLQPKLLLADGDFVLNALAVQTSQSEASVSLTPSFLQMGLSTPTPAGESVINTPRLIGTPSATGTPIRFPAPATPRPGTAYPNPHPSTQ